MMKKINYWELLKKSFLLFFKNLVLLLPLLLTIAFFIGLGIVAGIEFLVLFLLNRAIIVDPSLIFSGVSLILFIFFVLVDILLVFWVSAYIRSMTIGMLKEIVDTGRADVHKIFHYGRKYFETYFKYLIIRILIFVLPAIVFAALGFLAFSASMVFGIIMAALLGLIFIAYAIFITFGLFFMDPMITAKEGMPVTQIVKGSFRYLKKDFWHMFCTWGIAVLVWIAVSIILSPFSMATQVLSSLGKTGVLVNVMGASFSIINTIINIIVTYWMSIFLFQSYFAKNK